jgi:hypothetical protein
MFGAHLSPGMHKYVYIAIYPFFPCTVIRLCSKTKSNTVRDVSNRTVQS